MDESVLVEKTGKSESTILLLDICFRFCRVEHSDIDFAWCWRKSWEIEIILKEGNFGYCSPS